jgi:hypothetical protein
MREGIRVAYFCEKIKKHQRSVRSIGILYIGVHCRRTEWASLEYNLLATYISCI